MTLECGGSPPLSDYRRSPLAMKLRATPAALLLAAAAVASCERQNPAVTAETSAQAPGSSVLAKLDSIVIPLIDFEDTSLEEAIDYLRVRSLELDSDKPIETRGMSILIRHSHQDSPDSPSDNGISPIGASQFQRIPRLRAENITLTQALVQTCEAADADAHVTSIGIVVCPQGTPPFPNFKSESGEVWKKLTP